MPAQTMEDVKKALDAGQPASLTDAGTTFGTTGTGLAQFATDLTTEVGKLTGPTGSWKGAGANAFVKVAKKIELAVDDTADTLFNPSYKGAMDGAATGLTNAKTEIAALIGEYETAKAALATQYALLPADAKLKGPVEAQAQAALKGAYDRAAVAILMALGATYQTSGDALTDFDQGPGKATTPLPDGKGKAPKVVTQPPNEAEPPPGTEAFVEEGGPPDTDGALPDDVQLLTSTPDGAPPNLTLTPDGTPPTFALTSDGAAPPDLGLNVRTVDNSLVRGGESGPGAPPPLIPALGRGRLRTDPPTTFQTADPPDLKSPDTFRPPALGRDGVPDTVPPPDLTDSGRRNAITAPPDLARVTQTPVGGPLLLGPPADATADRTRLAPQLPDVTSRAPDIGSGPRLGTTDATVVRGSGTTDATVMRGQSTTDATVLRGSGTTGATALRGSGTPMGSGSMPLGMGMMGLAARGADRMRKAPQIRITGAHMGPVLRRHHPGQGDWDDDERERDNWIVEERDAWTDEPVAPTQRVETRTGEYAAPAVSPSSAQITASTHADHYEED